MLELNYQNVMFFVKNFLEPGFCTLTLFFSSDMQNPFNEFLDMEMKLILKSKCFTLVQNVGQTSIVKLDMKYTTTSTQPLCRLTAR